MNGMLLKWLIHLWLTFEGVLTLMSIIMKIFALKRLCSPMRSHSATAPSYFNSAPQLIFLGHRVKSLHYICPKPFVLIIIGLRELAFSPCLNAGDIMKRTVLVQLPAVVVVLVSLVACSTPSEPTNLNDGSKGYRITCGGAFATTASCYEKAGAICGNKGYAVLHENSIAPPADSNYFWNAAAFETIIKCNNR